MSFDDELEVAPPKSRASTRATARPSRAACAATDAPMIPPPTTSRSNRRPARSSIDRVRLSIRGSCPNPACLVGLRVQMPATALALALGAAFLHAFWNLLVAGARDIQATTAVALVVGVAAFAPVAAFAWDAESRVWPFLAVTSLLQLLYFVLLTAAYSRADLSFVYPIARGSAP